MSSTTPGDFSIGASDTDKESLSETVSRRIIALIQTDKLSPGATLPSEVRLSEELGISRGIVRQAIQGLSQLGIVQVGNGRRPRVGRVDGRILAQLTDHAVQTEQVSVQQTLDVRRVIEVRTAQLAALHRTPIEAERILKAAAELERASGDFALMTRHDIAFHILVATASRNPLLRLQVESFSLVIERTGPIGWQSRQSEALIQRQVDVHRQIAEAITGRDAVLATRLMTDHFTETVTVLAQAGFH